MLKKNKTITIVITVFLSLGAIFFLFPFLWMILCSFKENADVMNMPPDIFQTPWTFEQYHALFFEYHFGQYFLNTVWIVIISMTGIVINSFAGYGFAKYDFPHKEKFFMIFLATMMIPAQVILVAVYMMLFNLNLTNTFIGMVLPGLASGYSIFLFRQFFSNISDEVIEAGRVEGFSEFQIFRKLVIPIAKPIFSIQIILTFIGAWNSFIWPTIIAANPDKYTLSVGLNLLQGEHANEVATHMAGASVMIIPVLIVFIIFNKKIVDGISFTGSK